MTEDEYVRAVLKKYEVQRGPSSPAEILGNTVADPITKWAGQYLQKIQYSGSYAKHTGVKGNTDVDIFISLSSDTPGSLKDIYNSLVKLANEKRWSARQQNTSVGININGTKADLVPGRIQKGYKNFHSLYQQKSDSWTQTNIEMNISRVLESGRIDEIRAIKIWRFLHNLDFPSIYLELFVLESLSGYSKTDLASNVLVALKDIGGKLSDRRIEDPSNTANVISETLTSREKQIIQRQANESSEEAYWEKIIW